MKATEQLDSLISQIPSRHKGMYFIIPKSLYKSLCVELKRTVKTYKGYLIQKVQ